MLKIILFCVFLFFPLFSTLYSESVIPPEFSGHIISTGSVVPGDVILIEITQDMELKIRAVRNTSQSVAFELTGGEGDAILSFLPKGQSSAAKTIDSEESVKFSATLAVFIDSIDENGLASVSGYRIFEAEGGRQEIRLTGTMPVSSLTPGTPVSFSRLLNSSLSYTHIASSSDSVISETDLVRDQVERAADSMLSLPADTDGEQAADAPAVSGEPTAEEGDTPVSMEEPAAGAPEGENIRPVPASSGLELSEERKRELFLQYMNEFMRLIFM